LEEEGIKIIEPIKSSNKILECKLIKPFYSALKLYSELRHFRPDIIHFFLPQSYLVGGFISLLIRGPKRVMSRRSLNDYQKKYPFLSKLEHWLHPKMTAILGNSTAVCQNLLSENIQPSKIGKIYNGINLSPVAINSAPPSIRKKLNLQKKCFVISITANLIYYKGHEDLLIALSIVKEMLPYPWAVLFIGRDDGIGGNLLKKAEHLNIAQNIRWLGSRNDVPDLLKISDIGVLCSHEEGFSNAILEGMAASLPMVVTNVGGNAEAVKNGKTGFVVNARQPQELADAILKLALDPELREKMGLAGRKRVETEFSLDRCITQYVQLYDGLLSMPNQSVEEMITRPGLRDE
jgi:glycosyltransferase involved in cell wall biosynthesis